MEFLAQVQRVLIHPVLIQPFSWLYMKGPRMLGFWEGLEEEAICSQLTNVRSTFWSRSEDNMTQCRETLERHFWSYIVLATTVSYYGGLVVLTRATLRKLHTFLQ